MTTYFTSDLHIGHVRCATVFANPPFASTDERDEAISAVFDVVGPGDTVYILGDLVGRTDEATRRRLADFLDSLPRATYHLVLGNHDPTKGKWRGLYEGFFDTVSNYKEIKPRLAPGGPRQKIVLSHYPFERWNASHKGSWHLFGHEHGTFDLTDNGTKLHRRMDVGIDATRLLIHPADFAKGYQLVSLEEVTRALADPKLTDTPHH